MDLWKYCWLSCVCFVCQRCEKESAPGRPGGELIEGPTKGSADSPKVAVDL
jgi:hypothetical protein